MPPRCILLAPRYGDEVVADAAMSRTNATRNDDCPPEDRIDVAYNVSVKSSLINFGFNRLLVEALNKRDEDGVEFMAMCHSDIVAAPGWLNHLHHILRMRGDVLVSAVVSIKEPERMRTSCAVGGRNDCFDVRRYIGVADRHALPQTFSTRDVAQEDDEVLLVNTGLWIADLSWEGWDEFAFSSRDEIRINPATGRRQAYSAPEDWQMSRFLAERGAPYSATWAIQTHHYGPSIWDSHAMPPVYPAFVPAGSEG